jgi:uncharacterized protein with von Willebrand factor type A (vWA) domain
VSVASGAALIRRLTGFGRVLREAGAEVGPGRLQDAVLALETVDLRSRDEVYWAMRCTLVSHQKDIEAFDAAFSAFWERTPSSAPEEPATQLPMPSQAEKPNDVMGPAPVHDRSISTGASDDVEDDRPPDRPETEGGMAWSAVERLRELDFASYSAGELRAARRLMDRIARAAPRRSSRRLTAAHDGRHLDKRRTLRAGMRTDGYPLERGWRKNRIVPRRLVFLVDVSGSMEPYARAMIMFLQAAVREGGHVEAFTFGTRLTRVTAELEGHDPERALRATAHAVHDWAGGTRIGAALDSFNRRYGPRGFTRGAVIVIASDGWERGDPKRLAGAMERLARAAHSIVWVNPLAGDPDYKPLAQGMSAALPYVTHFVPGQNLRALEGLASVLEQLPLTRARHAQSRR